MKKRAIFLTVFLAWTVPAWTQPAIHDALRALRGRLLTAMNKNDINGILAELHPNVVVTWQNAEVSRGPAGVRAYLERMTKGPNPIVRGYHAEINVDDLTTLYGENTGVAYGSSVENFDLAGGQSFTLHGRWSATMVRENGRWLLASVHASSNLFDNPLLNAAKKFLYLGIAVSFLAALLMGWFVGRRFSKPAA